STPAYSHDELIDIVSNALESDVSVHSRRIVPVSTPLDTPIVQACLRALPGARPFGSPTASDWIFLSDVPTVKIGPGSSELSHTGAEHVEIAERHRAGDAYRAALTEYFASICITKPNKPHQPKQATPAHRDTRGTVG